MATIRAAEQRWVFRPGQSRPSDVTALSGAYVHAAGVADASGTGDIVLQDGTHVRANRAEIVVE